MSRRYVWPLIGLFAVALTPRAAPAKPGDGAVKPAAPAAVPLPNHKQKLITPPCSTPSGSTPIYVPAASRRATKIKAQYSIGAIGETIKLRATLTTEDGLKVPYQTVEFKVDNQVVGAAETNSEGEASLKYKVPNKFGPKPVVARFTGNRKCRSTSDSSSLGTVRSSTTVKLFPGEYANVNTKTHLRGRLSRNTDDASIGGREVEIYAQGKKIKTVTTDSAGQLFAEYTPTSGAGKPLDFKVQFLGDVLYNPTSATGDVALYPPRKTVFLTAQSVVARYGETVNVVVLARTGNAAFGPKYAGATIHASRERGPRWAWPHYAKRYLGTGTTNNLGVAQVSFKVMDDPTAYHLWVSADVPRERYDVKQQPEATLTVLKSPVKLSIAGPGSVRVGESASFDVTVRRTTDSQGVEGLRVCSATRCADTNSQGKATLTFTIPGGSTGTRTFSFESRADDHHLKGAKDHSVQALPSIN